MTDTQVLPAGFEDLALLAQKWARPNENARSQIRWSASPEDFAAFYAAFMPRLDAVLAHLSRHDPAAMPEDVARNLFHLACAFAEAAPHHELYDGSAQVPHSFDARRFVPAHGDMAE